ncbi:MAG: hypothetical protein A2092_11995 [Rhodobacteraceae bacterium GWE1_64_9]|nr:MAG: hypothetical protein A2092_11995 [Rhodobacteraceae bacterium GWE1_64_9]HBD91797.1 hypothetical protein [Gemmobacter sp.]HBU14064.1 hypothetical protein [Gemmobacter sp.]
MTQQLPACIEDLPASLIDVAETLGLRVALALIQNFGGRELRVPVRPAPDHPLIIALGEQDGFAVCHFLAGQTIYVPLGRAGGLRRNAATLDAKGYDRGAIARMLGISQRHVRRLLNDEADQDSRQGSLFPEE